MATLTGPLCLSAIFWVFKGAPGLKYDAVNVFLVLLALLGGLSLARIKVQDAREGLEV